MSGKEVRKNAPLQGNRAQSKYAKGFCKIEGIDLQIAGMVSYAMKAPPEQIILLPVGRARVVNISGLGGFDSIEEFLLIFFCNVFQSTFGAVIL